VGLGPGHDDEMLIPVLVLFLAAALGPTVHRLFGRRAGVVLATVPGLLFAHFARSIDRVAAGRASAESWDWVSGLGVRLAFRLDGLSLLFALLVTGIGALVLIYGASYLGKDERLPRFYAAMFFFMAAMLGLVLADDAVALFVFWELTSVSSYLLIGFDHEKEYARKSALQALFVTGAGGLALLAGLILLGQMAGTLRLSDLAAQAPAIQGHELYLPALLLILLGAFTKSAQFPFHFWLPGAMAAPSPVSAYLHSATMVKAGVYLLARLNPALGGTDAWHYLVILAGTATLVTGAVLAYGQTDLKRLLAFTTVSALGTLTLLVGISTEASARAAMVFLVVHALYKAALFLGVGTIDHEAGTRDARALGGLARAMPLTAVAVVASALSMAGLPPMFGFIAKELFYEAKQEAPRAGPILVYASLVGSAFVAAAAGLVGWRPFFGRRRREAPKHAHEGPPALWFGPLVLAVTSVALGLLPDLLAVPLVQPAASAMRGEPTLVELSPWMGMSPAFVQSLLMLAIGVALYKAHDRSIGVLAPLGRLGSWGPARAYDAVMAAIVVVAKAQTRVLQNGVLGLYLLVTIGTTVVVGAYALVAGGVPVAVAPARVTAVDATVVLAMLAGAVAVLRAKTLLVAVAALGVVGYGIAVVFLLFSGPDLALTQFAIETLSALLFLLVLRRLPRLRTVSTRAERLRDGAVALAGGVFVTVLVLAATAAPHPTKLRDYFASASLALANGRNVVNVILVDFRALDTLGEITVLSVAALGVAALLQLRVTSSTGRAGVYVPSPILRAGPRFLVMLMLVFSLFLLVRGHNEPGGGFVGGLVAATAFALVLLAAGVAEARRLLRREPVALVALGLLLAVLSGLPALIGGAPFLTGLWAKTPLPVIGKLGSPLVFDIGVYLVVLGISLAILFALAEEER
jgi:multicomponent Na+:H+ antiporter subunit A